MYGQEGGGEAVIKEGKKIKGVKVGMYVHCTKVVNSEGGGYVIQCTLYRRGKD